MAMPARCARLLDLVSGSLIRLALGIHGHECAHGFILMSITLELLEEEYELVLAALEMALEQRKPEEVIHHSDQGSQYTSIAFGQRCRDAGVRPSMGSVGDCYDNAMCESFFATLECELLDRERYETRAEGRMAVFRFIEGWYNPHRRHSALEYQSPMTYEKKHQEQFALSSPSLSTEAG